MARSVFVSNSSLLQPTCLPQQISRQFSMLERGVLSDRQSGKASIAAPIATINSEMRSGTIVAPVVVTKATTSFNLARMWREIQGSNDWEDLVEPLNPLLREEIIRYGEFVAACYKAFDLHPRSKRYLNCKYGKNSMLKEVGMEGCGYRVTKYIYATPNINIPIQNWTSCSRWIGYVAVSSDDQVKRLGRRDVVIAFRGTVTNSEWIANFMSSLTTARLDPQNPRLDVKVELGFLNLYTSADDSTSKFGHGSCREQLLSEISRIKNEYKNEQLSITVAGHSMGSALALLLAYDITELGLNKTQSDHGIPTTVYSFGGPRVGNSSFKERCKELGAKVLRIVNVNDPITKLPGVFLNENFRVLGGRYELPWSSSCYAHVGVEIALNFIKMQNPSCVHDMETYIDLLRCPERVPVHRGEPDFLNKAREFFSAEKLERWPWKNSARNKDNLV
ncbi:phospholipase A1-Ialpha2, chloroplastic-like [Magnolia sinica]|uniref:phospholipase A1-Ialpha2, chloroplastic-like n=1 Tax=Magnolia sinica TaxID=86752 RepID=UPI00265ADEFB|nr:phospholipase A1-Ialpha2, chloroplastic-like [Magnolia sinica]